MWIIYLVVAVIATYLFLVFPKKPKRDDYMKFTKRSYAHRGFHDNEAGPSENTLEAFVLASDNNYGIELDVQLTRIKES